METRSATAAWFAVVRAYRTCEAQYERVLAHFGLSTAQYEVLNIVHELGGSVQPTRIAERLLVTRGNVTGLLARLQGAGWVTMTLHPTDGRSRCVELTPRAQRVVEAARAATARFIEQQCAPFTPAELAATGGIMERMRAHLETLDVARIASGANVARPSRSRR